MTTVSVGRKYSQQRLSAYECEVDSRGIPLRRGKYIKGWYGRFDESRLQSEIMPELAEYAARKGSYPFLITHHWLEGSTAVDISPPRYLKFHPRKRRSGQTWLAVVLSSTEFKLLS